VKAGRCIALMVLFMLCLIHSARAREQNEWPIVHRWSVTLNQLPFSWPQNQHEANQIPKQKIVSLVTGAENASQAMADTIPRA
jgi:hypothetical protein